LVDAVKFAFSREARDGAATLIDMLNRSPAWQKEICTLEATISIDERERTQLLEDLVAQKLHSLSYQKASITGFRTAFGELTANAFEHGTRNVRRKTIRLIVDVSPTYVATSVFNPAGSPVDLPGWIQQSQEHLRSTDMRGRGRGLLTLCRHVDVVEPLKATGIKAIVYRDAVTFETKEIDGSTLVVARTGQSNPSFGRRVVEFVRRLGPGKIALCLNPWEVVQKEVRKHESKTGSWCLPPILELVAEYARASDKSIRIVCGDEDLRDLLPDEFVSPTVDAAIEAMKLPDAASPSPRTSDH
jgi:anti-sigma regulatory factor (Ser/Thr protein kinase)